MALQRAVALNKGSGLAKGLCKHTPSLALHTAAPLFCIHGWKKSVRSHGQVLLQSQNNMLCKQSQVQPDSILGSSY